MNYELHHNCTNCTMPPAVVSTFASPHEPTLRPKARKRASAFPAQVAQRALGFTHMWFILVGVRESLRLFANPQKNKINLYFVDRSVRIDKDNKMIAK